MIKITVVEMTRQTDFELKLLCATNFKPIAYDYIMQVYTLILEGKILLDLVPKSQKGNLCNCALTSYLLIRYLQSPFFFLCIYISHLLLIHS